MIGNAKKYYVNDALSHDDNKFVNKGWRYLDYSFGRRPSIMAKRMIYSWRFAGRVPKLMNKPLLFLHVPKTGGTSVTIAANELGIYNFGHIYPSCGALDICPVGLTPVRKDLLKKYYVFSIVRNPISLLASYFNHVIGSNGLVNSAHYDYAAASKGFPYLVDTILNRQGYWPDRRGCFIQVTCAGAFVERVFQLENITSDFRVFTEQFSANVQVSLPHARKGDRTLEITRNISDGLKSKIYDAWSHDFHNFGYSLE